VSSVGLIHHVELWVSDLGRAERSWGWLLTALGYAPFQTWERGRSWRLASAYIVAEQSSDVVGGLHERRAPGMNHLAFHVGDRANVERLSRESLEHGWTVMFDDRHPYAGGPDHYAAYLENEDGFEVELCASAVE
jgi:catechol 2,3-dioxygenase-like lactoylglutathione lyase family enzyme